MSHSSQDSRQEFPSRWLGDLHFLTLPGNLGHVGGCRLPPRDRVPASAALNRAHFHRSQNRYHAGRSALRALEVTSVRVDHSRGRHRTPGALIFQAGPSAGVRDIEVEGWASYRDLSENFVAWASRPLSRERPAPARARAGCPISANLTRPGVSSIRLFPMPRCSCRISD
jgi:hypothetical protein